MKLCYYKDPVGNFGDDLNPWLWYGLAPELFDDDSNTMLVGIGTVLSSKLPAAPRKLVFGSGVGYGALPRIDSNWEFFCVRGPLSAEILGLDKSLALSDPAVLITQVMPPSTVERTGMVSFMPHQASPKFANWQGICDAAGINYLHPAANMHEIVAQIRQSRLVIAEAMHGAIVADAFRTPWVPVVCYDHILRFKWDDWCQSLGMTYAPLQLERVWDDRMLAPRDLRKTQLKRQLLKAGIWSPAWTRPVPESNFDQLKSQMAATLQSIASNATSYLSEERNHLRSIDQLLEKLEQLKRARRLGLAAGRP